MYEANLSTATTPFKYLNWGFLALPDKIYKHYELSAFPSPNIKKFIRYSLVGFEPTTSCLPQCRWLNHLDHPAYR